MLGVLLLNISHEPLAVISVRRALSLILRERVEPACDAAYELKGVSTSFQIPTIVRLRRYVNVPWRGVRWNRRAVLRRDRYTCAYCGVRVGMTVRARTLTRREFTVDHIVPVSRGGRDSWTNTVCACTTCNHQKGNRTPYEASMELRWKPEVPRVTYWVASGEIPSEWEMYLRVSL
jgi:5-methylcytosine-specific restriction endonuclease McrA